MLLPMPPMQVGPPSQLAITLKPWLLVVLVLQLLVCLARVVFLLDIMGGFIMFIMVAFGWYGWKENMHITYICSWGALCTINGAFDAVRVIDYVVKATEPLVSSNKSFAYNAAGVTLISIPITCFLGTIMAWCLFRDCEHAMGPAYDAESRPYGDVERRPLMGGPAAGSAGAPAGPRGSGPAPSYTAPGGPFAGQGHRLGD